MSKRRRIRYPIGGETALFLSSTSTGLVLGVPGTKDPRNPHITVTKEEGTIGRHLTYDEPSGKRRIPLGKATPEQLARLADFVRPRIIPCPDDQIVWVPTRDFIFKLAGSRSEKEKAGEIQIPPAIFRELLDADLGDPRKWVPSTVSRLEPSDLIAFSMLDGLRCLVFPRRPGRVVKLTIPELLGELSLFLDVLGVRELLRTLREGDLHGRN